MCVAGDVETVAAEHDITSYDALVSAPATGDTCSADGSGCECEAVPGGLLVVQVPLAPFSTHVGGEMWHSEVVAQGTE